MYSFLHKNYTRISLTALAVLFAGQFACDDKGTEPKPPEPVDYPVYFSEPGFTPQLFVFHPETRQVDSVDIPWETRNGVTVSADGKLLYLAQTFSVLVVDTDSLSSITDSLSFIAELPYDSDDPVAVSPDNQLVAITGDDLTILRTSDYSVLFSDTDRTLNGQFSTDSKSFYCAAGWSSQTPGLVYKVDLSDSLFPVTRRLFADGGVTHVIPSLDDSKWFLSLRVRTWTSAFEVYDVATDSIIFREILVPGSGQIAITPDGKRIFYNNPGRSGTDPPAPPGFTIFDVEANKVDRLVEDLDFFSGSTWVAHPNAMAVTPDGRWLSILGGSLALRVLYLYDINSGQLVFREPWGGNSHAFRNISIQSAK